MLISIIAGAMIGSAASVCVYNALVPPNKRVLV